MKIAMHPPGGLLRALKCSEGLNMIAPEYKSFWMRKVVNIKQNGWTNTNYRCPTGNEYGQHRDRDHETFLVPSSTGHDRTLPYFGLGGQ